MSDDDYLGIAAEEESRRIEQEELMHQEEQKLAAQETARYERDYAARAAEIEATRLQNALEEDRLSSLDVTQVSTR